MKQLLSILFITMSLFGYSQKDSLAKYTDQQIINKMNQEFDHPSEKIKFYGDVLLRRNSSDSIKSEACYNLAQYYELLKKDFQKKDLYFEKSFYFAKKSNYYNMMAKSMYFVCKKYYRANEYEKLIEVLSIINVLPDKNVEFDIDLLRIKSITYHFYFLMQDYQSCIAGHKKIIRQFEEYQNKNFNLSKEVKIEINAEKLNCYSDLICVYNDTKQLDSASVYIQIRRGIVKKYKLLDSFGDWDYEALNFIFREKYDTAIGVINAAQKTYIKDDTIAIQKSQYYYALCYHGKKDYKRSLDYCEHTLDIPKASVSFRNYDLELYKLAADNAKALGNTVKYNLYTQKYAEISQKINHPEKAAFMAKLYEQNELNPLKKELAAKSSRATMLFWGLSFASIAAGYLIFRIAKSRKEKKKFLAIIERLENKGNIETAPAEIEEPVLIDVEEEEISSQKNISSATETKILKKLENFERRQRFLEPNISLGTLALDFKTNTTYITYVIKKHKNENLINYINKLRIDYIIQKMASDPEYANYKIEYLAQESGFASYSTFKRIFTKETGIDPSKFINYLKQAN